jgi:hypothetical protein
MTTRTKIGLAGTVVWTAAMVGFLIWKRQYLGAMTLSEWGDFFSGVVAPVAFLWLILGYIQQGEEVRLNTEALKLQQEELRHQVEETAALVEATQRQAAASAEQLTLEKQQVADALRREKEKIQPTFHFLSGSGQGNTWEMRFRNNGGPATALAIPAAPTGTSIHIHPNDHLPSNSEGRIVTGNVTKYPVIITVAYRDARGDPGECRLELHEPGSFRPAPPDNGPR